MYIRWHRSDPSGSSLCQYNILDPVLLNTHLRLSGGTPNLEDCPRYLNTSPYLLPCDSDLYPSPHKCHCTFQWGSLLSLEKESISSVLLSHARVEEQGGTTYALQ